VIVLLPVLWTGYFLYPKIFSDPFLLAGSGIIALALIYFFGMVIKDMGTRYANRFWNEVGGTPSTRMCRMRDPYLSVEQKHRIHAAVRSRLGIQLLSFDQEMDSPDLADRRIMDAFREVKELLRHSGQSSLVEKHNAEYGAARNLCGARSVLLTLAVLGTVVCGYKGQNATVSLVHAFANAGFMVNLSILLIWLPFGWMVLPEMVHMNANNYAESAWMSFLSLSEVPGKKPSASQHCSDAPEKRSHSG
jgi:hypothetical protein